MPNNNTKDENKQTEDFEKILQFLNLFSGDFWAAESKFGIELFYISENSRCWIIFF